MRPEEITKENTVWMSQRDAFVNRYCLEFKTWNIRWPTNAEIDEAWQNYNSGSEETLAKLMEANMEKLVIKTEFLLWHGRLPTDEELNKMYNDHIKNQDQQADRERQKEDQHL